jgi:hypothetical protein
LEFYAAFDRSFLAHSDLALKQADYDKRGEPILAK